MSVLLDKMLQEAKESIDSEEVAKRKLRNKKKRERRARRGKDKKKS